MVHALSRRQLLLQAAGAGAVSVLGLPGARAAAWPKIEATFLFACDIHACRMASGLSPHCLEEGKTDDNLRRHIAALNRVGELNWPSEINGVPTQLAGSGKRIGASLGLVIGGDMTDDGGGQVTLPHEGTQLLQFSQRYQQGTGPDRVHVPVYVGLGNHDLDQDGPPPHVDWYRREMRDYVEINHRPSVFFKPPVPAGNYDMLSDSYSWDWGGLHLVQTHRFAGDTAKGAVSALDWLKQDLKDNAGDGRPVVLFQHYGWDPFSTEAWDAAANTFDDSGSGQPHWWSDDDRRALLQAIGGYNVIGIFHGHEHKVPMAYKRNGLDLFKPIAAFKGGFAVVRITDAFMDVVLAEAGQQGDITFTNAFTKKLSGTP
ncbi:MULTISPECIES: metallophosphoesterase [Hyphomicrobiales]|uniref:metallophosphoesterase n=1 Tax=Hyphomicrobiales TaxID=356 RepID=UPI00036B8854|nr:MULTISPECIES: metallophosphoesterase [Phyllobacteriaceae]MCX8572228.1 metallophosphoesterase [Aminobacter sp. MET-1]